jgi:hypothetical protein
MKRILAFALIGLLAAAHVPTLHAQAGSATGVVSGSATANTRRSLSGLTIQIRNAGGTIVGSAVTDSEGKFSFPGLAAGRYTVECLGEKKQVIGTANATLTPPSTTVRVTCAFDAAALWFNKKALTALGAAAVAIGAVAIVSTKDPQSGAR